MVFRAPRAAPQSRITAERRGPVVGRFCHGCGSVYSIHRHRHTGDPLHGRDHIASPCSYEGQEFTVGADWWEPAVEVRPPSPVAEPQAATGS